MNAYFQEVQILSAALAAMIAIRSDVDSDGFAERMAVSAALRPFRILRMDMLGDAEYCAAWREFTPGINAMASALMAP